MAQEKPGDRVSYMFWAQRVRVTRKGKLQEAWAVFLPKVGRERAPRSYLSNADLRITPLETLAYVGGSRWPIETEFETEKGDVGLNLRDPFSLPAGSHGHSHVPAEWSVPAGPSSRTGDREKMPRDHPSPGVPSVVREMLPRWNGSDRKELLLWLEDTQSCNRAGSAASTRDSHSNSP